jgi:hypothetical protein
MFIIERRTAGVLAALATTAAMAVLGNVWDRVEEVATPSTANSTAAFAASVGPRQAQPLSCRRTTRLCAGLRDGATSCPSPGCLAHAGSQLLNAHEQANNSSTFPK